MQELLYFAVINMFTTCIGYVLAVRQKVVLSWILCIASVSLIHAIFLAHTSPIRMFRLIATAFTGMKAVTTAAAHDKNWTLLTFRQWLAFVFTWAGMRAEIFGIKGSKPLPGAKRMIVSGLRNIAAGCLLILIARWIADSPRESFRYPLITALLLTAFSLILHFGLLNISAGIWRYFGIEAYYLFKNPLKARTLNEFWSRRWNIAFSEMTSIAVFRPVKQKLGPRFGLLAAFVFSGVLHEIAISVPVRSHYGLPLLYFVIQALAVITEKALIQKQNALVQKAWFQKIWLLFWLLAPIPLLFHKPFVTGIIWTLAGVRQY